MASLGRVLRPTLLATLAAFVVLAAGAGAETLGCSPYAIGTTTIRGTTDDDDITGCAGADRIDGRAGNDTIEGLLGDDRLVGGSGNDVLVGGPGKDSLSGGTGADLVSGGAGFDVVDVRDKSIDTVRCGAGKDMVRADRHDNVARDCERVLRTGGAP